MSRTPGPWKFEFGYIVGNDGELIANVQTFDDVKKRKANASLLSAAPELLHCAKCALAELEGILPEFETGGDRQHPAWETLKELKAVIAKATEELIAPIPEKKNKKFMMSVLETLRHTCIVTAENEGEAFDKGYEIIMNGPESEFDTESLGTDGNDFAVNELDDNELNGMDDNEENDEEET